MSYENDAKKHQKKLIKEDCEEIVKRLLSKDSNKLNKEDYERIVKYLFSKDLKDQCTFFDTLDDGESHVLKNRWWNLYKDIRGDAIGYFHKNKIKWWTLPRETSGAPTGDTISSQIACLNHLFMIRHDGDAVLAIINNLEKPAKAKEFKKVIKIPYDDKEEKGYIAFEVVSKNNLLGEGTPTRGANCTSLDALIYAEDEDGKKWIILIEWKYTEKYGDKDNKSLGKSGETRMKRYRNLIEGSVYLKTPKNNGEEKVYYQEPFYQLMRQTLWAEQVIKPDGKEKDIEADDYLHLHVIPSGNKTLLNKVEKWKKDKLKPAGKARYKVIDPEVLLKPIANDEKYKDLIDYLKKRYWQK